MSDYKVSLESLYDRVYTTFGVSRLCRYHRITPQAYPHLKKKNLNAAEAEELQVFMAGHAKVVLTQVHALNEIASKFSELKVSMMALKGTVLSHILYGNYISRQCGDLDILISAKDLDKADEILVGLGYERILPKNKLTPKQNRYNLKWQKHNEYGHPKKNVCVDLHWRLFESGFQYLDVMNPDVWRAADKRAFFGNIIYTPGLQHYLLYLCIHGATSGWRRLRWALDLLAFLEEYHGKINWEEIITIAKRWQVTTMLGQSMLLMRYLFKYPIPEELETLVIQRKIKWLAKRAIAEIDNKAISKYEYKMHLYRLKLLPNSLAKLQLIINTFTGKFPDAVGRIKLPDKLFFGYYPMMVLRQVIKIFIYKPITYLFGQRECEH